MRTFFHILLCFTISFSYNILGNQFPHNQILADIYVTRSQSFWTIAAKFSSVAKSEPAKENICTTWLFLLENREYLEPSDTNHFEYFPTFIYIEEEGSYTDPTSKTDYFYYREKTLAELYFPRCFRSLKFSPNCVSVLARVEKNQANKLIFHLNKLVLTKILKPNIDYFIVIGRRTPIKDFDVNYFSTNLKYKYFLTYSSENETHMGLLNSCGKNLSLYSRKCPKLFAGKLFRISATLNLALVKYRRNPVTDKLEWGGGSFLEILNAAGPKYNFTYDVRYSKFNKGSSGYRFPNGTWVGAIGEVFNHDADFGFSTAFTEGRHFVTDTSVTLLWMSRVIYIRLPTSRKSSWTSVFWPLQAPVWLLTLLVVVLLQPLLWGAAIKYFDGNAHIHFTKMYLFTEVSSAIVRIFLEQALTLQHWKGHRIRFLVWVWTMFCLVIGTGYRSKLISFLTFIPKEELPKTHEELSVSDYMIYFRYYAGPAYKYVNESSLAYHRRILEKSSLINSSYECMIAAVLKEKSACLEYDFNGDYGVVTNTTLYANGKSVLVKSNDKDYTLPMPITVRKGSPYLQTIDEIVLNVLATGLYSHWVNQHWFNSKIEAGKWLRSQNTSKLRKTVKKLLDEDEFDLKPLNLGSVKAIFGCTFLGVVLSLLIFIYEANDMIGINKLKTRLSRKNRTSPNIE